MSTPPMLDIDEADRLVRVCFKGARSRQVTDALIALYAARPEVSGWSFIYDARDYDDVTSLDDINRLAAADREAKKRCSAPAVMRTGVVTHDRFFNLWAKVLNHQFPGRDVRGFPTPEAARRFVGCGQAGSEAA